MDEHEASVQWTAEDEVLLARYLLGQLPEEEQSAVEQRYFNSDGYFQHVLVVEDELIDKYLQGSLSERNRQLFEQNFLTSARRREKLELAQALMETLGTTAVKPAGKRRSVSAWLAVRSSFASQPRLIRWAVPAVVTVLAVGACWLAVESLRLRKRIEGMYAEKAVLLRREQEQQQQMAEQRARADHLAEQLRQEKKQQVQLEQQLAKVQKPASLALSFVLTPGLVREGGHTPKLLIPKEAEVVRFELHIPGEDTYPSFRAALETLEGEEVWSHSQLLLTRAASGEAVVPVLVPRRALRPGDYLLILEGMNARGDFEKLPSYFFSVVNQ
jgi:hypothetical protein